MGAMLGGTDGEHRAGDAFGEPVENAFALDLAQRCGRPEIDTELHTRIRGVDTLTAGSRSSGKLFCKLFLRHPKATGCARPRGHMQVIHAVSLP